MSLQSRLDREIELIENDDSLSNSEKSKEIRELYREAHEIENRREEEY